MEAPESLKSSDPICIGNTFSAGNVDPGLVAWLDVTMPGGLPGGRKVVVGGPRPCRAVLFEVPFVGWVGFSRPLGPAWSRPASRVMGPISVEMFELVDICFGEIEVGFCSNIGAASFAGRGCVVGELGSDSALRFVPDGCVPDGPEGC